MSKSLVIPFRDLRADRAGYSQLAWASATARASAAKAVIFDFREASFVEAHLAAPLGAVLRLLQHEGKDVMLVGWQAKVAKILQTNHFLCVTDGMPAHVDVNDTTIRYAEFKLETLLSEVREYLDEQVLERAKLNVVPLEGRKAVRRLMLELFVNARDYSKSRPGVFACGQLYPASKRLDLSIADVGQGFAGSLKNKVGNIPDAEAVRRVLHEGLSSKIDIPGGLGIQQVDRFVSDHGGRFQILSGNALWQSSPKPFPWSMSPLSSRFPGTVVNVEFQVDMTKQVVNLPYKFRDLF